LANILLGYSDVSVICDLRETTVFLIASAQDKLNWWQKREAVVTPKCW